jgi:hypothetical protein
MEKDVTPKHKGLKSKTYDEKRSNPKMQGVQIIKKPPTKLASPS